MIPIDFQRDIAPPPKREPGGSHNLGRLTRLRVKELDRSTERYGLVETRKRHAILNRGASASKSSNIAGSFSCIAVLAVFLTTWAILRMGGKDAGGVTPSSESTSGSTETPNFSVPTASEAIASVKRRLDYGSSSSIGE